MFSDYLENVYNEPKELPVLGDMNIKLLKSDENITHNLMHVMIVKIWFKLSQLSYLYFKS